MIGCSRLPGGFESMLPRKKGKWCNLVSISVYFDQIWALKNSKITMFYINNNDYRYTLVVEFLIFPKTF